MALKAPAIFTSSSSFSRGAKRQRARSTVKGLGNFLVLKPGQFCSDFLFGPNYMGICCYFESDNSESIFNRALHVHLTR